MNFETGKPVSYAAFKNKATIHRYGKEKIVLFGQPNNNLFAVYTIRDTDPNTMKEAYGKFVRLVKGDTTDYKSSTLQWSKGGIPTEYTDLK